MDGSRRNPQLGLRAAQRVAAEPAFAALDASGAPIIVVAGEPLSIIHLNAAARAVFGDDAGSLAARLFQGDQPSGRRLSELVGSLRHSTALRLERLRLQLDAAPQTVTVLCRRFSTEDEAPFFAIAALGVRPAAAGDVSGNVVAAPAPVVRERVLATGELRNRLSARHGARSPRFVWKTDAAARFIDVTHVLADNVGEHMADILGRSVGEVAEAFHLGPALVKAIASGKSWSGVEVDWPLDEAGACVPVTLGALPVTDAAHRFQGYQGYGVLHLDRAHVSGEAPSRVAEWRPPEEKPADQPAEETPIPENLRIEPPSAFELAPEPPETDPQAEPPIIVQYPDNIVRLRPPTARFNEPDPVVSDASPSDTLTVTERSAFDEIARALKNGGFVEATDDGARQGTMPDENDAVWQAARSQLERGSVEPLQSDALSAPVFDAPLPPGAEPVAGAPVPTPAPQAELETILNRLPVGVLVAWGAQSLFVNRTLLDYLGYADHDAFERDGGLARMFFGRSPNSGAAPEGGARPVAVQASDGEALDADAHLQIVDWQGAPATLLTLRRNRFHPIPGPDETALALARSLEEKLARVRAESAVFEAAFETAEGTAILVDQGRIEKANAAFTAFVGVERRALQERNVSSILVPESARALADRLSHMDRAEGPLRLILRGRIGALDAKLQRLDARRIALTLREPAPRTPDENEAARLAAEHASAAKSDFLARISHEIRTPLNAIIGFAEVMLEERLGPMGSERYKEYLKDIHSSGSHVLSLVNDLLDLSKIEAGKMELAFERVDANAIITECASIMQTEANRSRVVMRLALAPQLPPVRADARSLKQILLNLFSNAVKFNEPGGQVIASTALTDAGCVVIRVKDTGIGMSDEEVQIALEPFKQIATTRQSTQRQRGTGLGLPLTKALIEANHASFTIKSRKNEGTLVEIAFPPPHVRAAE